MNEIKIDLRTVGLFVWLIISLFLIGGQKEIRVIENKVVDTVFIYRQAEVPLKEVKPVSAFVNNFERPGDIKRVDNIRIAPATLSKLKSQEPIINLPENGLNNESIYEYRKCQLSKAIENINNLNYRKMNRILKRSTYS